MPKPQKPYRTARGVSHGMAERPQRAFELERQPQVANLDPELARTAGFQKPEDENDYTPSLGATASADALKALIETGRPEFRNQVWVPHRPPRPQKSEGGKKFKLVAPFEPKGDQPQAIEELVKGLQDNERMQVLLGRHRLGQDLHDGADHRAAAAAGADPGAEQDAGGAALWRVQVVLSRKTRSSISSATTITTSRKPTCRAPTPISKKIPRSTSRSTACATPPPARCWSATTW